MKTENCTQLSISRWSDDGRNVGRQFVYRHATKCKEEQKTTEAKTNKQTKRDQTQNKERNMTKLGINKKCDQMQNKEV